LATPQLDQTPKLKNRAAGDVPGPARRTRASCRAILPARRAPRLPWRIPRTCTLPNPSCAPAAGAPAATAGAPRSPDCASARRPRDRSRQGRRKRRYFERFRITCQCVIAETSFVDKATGGTSTRYHAGGQHERSQLFANASPAHSRRRQRRERPRRVAGPGPAARCAPSPRSRDDSARAAWCRIRGSAAQAAADRQVLLQREVGPNGVPQRALSSFAARTHRSSLARRRAAARGAGSPRRCARLRRHGRRGRFRRIPSAAGGSRRRAGEHMQEQIQFSRRREPVHFHSEMARRSSSPG